MQTATAKISGASTSSTSMEPQDDALADSWRDNAAAWTRAVRDGLIPSRRAGTDAAIIAAVLAQQPCRVLDAGCGEGWLVRALAAHGVDAEGFDAQPALIDAARSASTSASRFFVADLLAFPPHQAVEPYDVIVLNFALFAQDLASILSALARSLTSSGALVIQTLHPLNDPDYGDGWRTETFSTMPGAGRWSPMPWYFHTLESWFAATSRAGLVVAGLNEPRDPESGRLLSLILTLSITAPAGAER